MKMKTMEFAIAYSIADILATAKKYGIEQPEQLPYDQLLSLIAKKGNGDAWETVASVISGANYLEPWELPRGN